MPILKKWILLFALLIAVPAVANSQRRWEKGGALPGCPCQPSVFAEVMHRAGWLLGNAGFDKSAGRVTDTMRLRQSLWFYSRAIRMEPTCHISYGSRGLTYFRLGEYDRALGAYQQALQQCPDDSWTLSNMGFIYFLKQDIGRAEDVYRSATEIDPEFIDARRNLGVALALQKRFQEAIDEWLIGLDHDADNAVLMFYIGTAFNDLGKTELANNWLEKAYTLDPTLKH